MRSIFIVIIVAAICDITFGRQEPERHFGCPPGKNACIYPIDEATLQCETYIDFQVALHIPVADKIAEDFRKVMKISIKVPNGDVMTPEDAFGKEPELRKWELEAFEDSADETPEGFRSYAANWRNVIFKPEYGKGKVEVEVVALGVTTKVFYEIRKPTKRRAKNVILFVGDGMAPPMIAAARLVSRGMVHGKFQGLMNMQKLPYHGQQNPSGVDSIITDSANSASTFNTGQKSSVNALGVYADSGDDTFAHPKVETIAEHIKRRYNMSTGVVTTAQLQGATPAAVWSHVRRRGEKAAITAQALNGCKGCVLAVQPDVMMGGGGKYFMAEDSIDGSDMYKNYSEAGYTVTHTRAQMKAAAKDPKTKKLLTVTHRKTMEVWLDRNVYTENLNDSDNSPIGDSAAPTDQPNLDEMTMSALEVLSKNKDGFYLMVEAASIDKSAHPLDIPRALSDLIELDNTVGQVVDWAKKNGDETMILVTADHGHGFDVFGTVDTKIWDDAVVATEENPVSDAEHMCKAVTDNKGRKFNFTTEPETGMTLREANLARRAAIGTYARAGYPDYVDSDGDGFPDTWEVRTTLAAGMNNYPDHTDDYKVSRTLKNPSDEIDDVNLNNPEDDPNGILLTGNLRPSSSTGVHTLQDVNIFGYGPGAEKVSGNVDNTEIFHIIAGALGFGTDGEFDTDEHAFGSFIKCKNEGGKCHCTKKDGKDTCACMPGNSETYVKPDMMMCAA